jgi:hypothetical protein
MEKAKKYTEAQMWEIVNHNNFTTTLCKNEPKENIDTIQVSFESEDDYFGEFVGNETDGYIFNIYTI